jgi:hypothetical protein
MSEKSRCLQGILLLALLAFAVVLNATAPVYRFVAGHDTVTVTAAAPGLMLVTCCERSGIVPTGLSEPLETAAQLETEFARAISRAADGTLTYEAFLSATNAKDTPWACQAWSDATETFYFMSRVLDPDILKAAAVKVWAAQ